MHDYSHAIFHRNRQVMAYIIQHLMVYTCIKYPLPGLVFTMILVNLLYITIDGCLLLAC